jgi:hypothetical protein
MLDPDGSMRTADQIQRFL